MSDKFVLDGHLPVRCENVIEWGKWFETADRKVAKTENEGVQVSTVFLGSNHNWGDGPPLLFETMIFGGKHDGDQERYSTREEAEAGHALMCARAFPQNSGINGKRKGE